MTSFARQPGLVRRFLGIAGAFPVAVETVFAAVWLGGLVELWQSGNAETATNLLMIILPFLAGTGLLQAAGQGHLDLLLGAGVERTSIWRAAMVRAVIVPSALAVILALTLAKPATLFGLGSMLLRAIATAAFVGGIGFAAGLAGPRYLAGTMWIAARLLFMLSPLGRTFLSALHTGTIDTLSSWTTLAALVAIPELLLDTGVPIGPAVPHLLTGLLALVFSFHRFRRADLGGRRAE